MIEEIWSINYKDALDFVWSLNTNDIKIFEYEPMKISNMVLERVRVIFEGKNEIELRKEFLLRFMKGGG